MERSDAEARVARFLAADSSSCIRRESNRGTARNRPAHAGAGRAGAVHVPF
jgi:hypothetical protein